jgi:hypothetical protein
MGNFTVVGIEQSVPVAEEQDVPFTPDQLKGITAMLKIAFATPIEELLKPVAGE